MRDDERHDYERAGKGKHGSGAHEHASSQRHSFRRPPYCSTGLAFGNGATPKLVAGRPTRGSLGHVSGRVTYTGPRRHDVPGISMAERGL